MTDYTNPNTLPPAPAGHRHVNPPRFARPKDADLFVSDAGGVLKANRKVGYQPCPKIAHGRRWIIEPEPAIGGPDDAKAHGDAKKHGYCVTEWRLPRQGEWAWTNSNEGPFKCHFDFNNVVYYILAPLGQPVVEPVEGETATPTLDEAIVAAAAQLHFAQKESREIDEKSWRKVFAALESAKATIAAKDKTIDAMMEDIEQMVSTDMTKPAPTRSDFEVWREALTKLLDKDSRSVVIPADITHANAALESAKATIAKLQAPTRSDFEVWQDKLSEILKKECSLNYSIHKANAALREHREATNVNRT